MFPLEHSVDLVVFRHKVLEMCMKSCGKRFHSEVGKFRFLNELIKVVSPKVKPPRGSRVFLLYASWCMCDARRCCPPPPQYLGSRSPEPVKKKVLELIYSWTLALPDETKITDAYQMLKKQGRSQKPRDGA